MNALKKQSLTFLKGNISPRIIVQGGAYRSMPPDKKEEYKGATKESARKGYDILMVSVRQITNEMTFYLTDLCNLMVRV